MNKIVYIRKYIPKKGVFILPVNIYLLVKNVFQNCTWSGLPLWYLQTLLKPQTDENGQKDKQ